jgi:hypothetical protein
MKEKMATSIKNPRKIFIGGNVTGIKVTPP